MDMKKFIKNENGTLHFEWHISANKIVESTCVEFKRVSQNGIIYFFMISVNKLILQLFLYYKYFDCF